MTKRKGTLIQEIMRIFNNATDLKIHQKINKKLATLITVNKLSFRS